MKRKLPPHIVLPNGQWRFVKRGSKHHRQTNRSLKVVHTAKRRYAKRAYSRARGLGGGKFTGVIPPLLGGIADSMIGNRSIMGFKVPVGIGSTLVGWFMHSQTTRDIGLYQIGSSIPSMFGASGGTALGGVPSQV